MSHMSIPACARTGMAPGFLLRVAGLPLAAGAALASAPVGAALARMRELECDLAGVCASLSDGLYAAIAAAQDEGAVQNLLLSLRRAVFNRRQPAPAALALGFERLPEPARADLHRWVALRAARQAHLRRAEQLLADQLPLLRRALKQTAADGQFRQGLTVANPGFERTLDDYLRADDAHLNRKLRQAERTLLLYVLRTVYKTSPLSTLTMVSVGRFEGRPGGMAAQAPEWGTRHAALPNVAALSRVAQALACNVARHPSLRLALQRGALRDGDRVRYWKRQEHPLSMSGPVHSVVSEARCSLHLTASLEAVLDALRHGPRCAAELVSELGHRLAMPPEQAFDYLQRLVDQGLVLLAGLRQSVFERDGWERFTAELDASAEPHLAAAASALRAAAAEVDRFAAAPGPQRLALMGALHGHLQQALALAGSQRPPPQPLLYEDTSAGSALVSAGAPAWHAALTDLGALQRMLGLFDPMLVSRLTLRNLFRRRFGAGGHCLDVAGFSDYFHDTFYRAVSGNSRSSNPFGRGTLNPLRLPEIAAIEHAQNELINAVEQACAAHTGQGDVELPDELVERLGGQAMGWQKWMANAFFVQTAGPDSGATLVLNSIYAGAGCTFGRFAHLYRDTPGEAVATMLRANLAALQGADMLFAELQGGHETNLNLHARVTEAELVLPGERGAAAPAMQIALDELSIRHDAGRDELYLYCTRLEKRIVPLYLGMLYPLILPELQTLLLHFAPPAILRTDVLQGARGAPERVTFRPRVRYRSVVLERARWLVPQAQVPVRAGAESDFAFMCRLDAWRTASGMPSEVFVKPLGKAAPGPRSQQIGGYGTGDKPVYIDLAQPLCVSLFEHIVAAAGGPVVLTERLPGAADALAFPDGQTRTHEYVVELTQGQP